MADDAIDRTSAWTGSFDDVELAPDAIMVHRDGRVLYLNTAALQLVGVTSAEEGVGRSVFEVVLPEHREEVEQRIAGIQQRGEHPGPVEIGVRTFDNRTVYCAAVERFRTCLRASDTLGRLGGEEFAAILPEIGRDGAAAAAERIRVGVAGEAIATGGGSVELTVSVGCTECRVGQEDVEDSLKRGDDALYEAKRRGRDRVVTS